MLITKQVQFVQGAIKRTYEDVISHLASRLVLYTTPIAMWVAITEIMTKMSPIPLLPILLPGYVLASLLLWFAAALIVFLCLSLSHALVVEKEEKATRVDLDSPPKRAEEARHLAYAWSCGLMGMTLLVAEASGYVEFRYEDPLLGMAGLNSVVEEFRLRIAQAGKETESLVGKTPESLV